MPIWTKALFPVVVLILSACAADAPPIEIEIAVSAPPIFAAPPIPTPPETTSAPVVVDVDAVEFVILVLMDTENKVDEIVATSVVAFTRNTSESLPFTPMNHFSDPLLLMEIPDFVAELQ